MELRKEMALLQKKIMMDTVSTSRKDFTQLSLDSEIADSVQCKNEFQTNENVFNINEKYFYFIITATAGDGHCSEVPPVHAVLKKNISVLMSSIEMWCG